VVLIDANLVPFFTDAVVSKLMAGSAADREELRKAAPAKAQVLDAFPQTVERMRKVEFPESIPCLVIAAERPPRQAGPDEAEQWKRVHEHFAAAASNRKIITVAGSGHFVMRDKPREVIVALGDFVNGLKTR
jgi:pimeloyl-ACP methyl ester carboxylesterase